LKLLFVTQVLDHGDGVLGFVPRWIEGFARAAERVRVIALEVGDTSGLPDNVDWRELGRQGRLRRYLRYQSLLEEAFAEGFDAVLAHMVPRYANLAARKARRHGAGLFLWYTHKGVDARLKKAVSLVDLVFTASAESMRIETPKRVVTGHGIDVQHFSPRDQNPVHPPRLLSVGRLTPAKDPLTVLTALSLVRSRGVEVGLDWVGSGLTASDEPYRKTVEEHVRLGGIEAAVAFHGAVPYPAVPEHFRRSTLFVSASRTGSVDKVVLEAMACGRPVVTCNESFEPILSALGPESARCLFPPEDAEALAARIEGWLRMEPAQRHQLGEKLRAIIGAGHEVDRLTSRLIAAMTIHRERAGGSGGGES